MHSSSTVSVPVKGSKAWSHAETHGKANSTDVSSGTVAETPEALAEKAAKARREADAMRLGANLAETVSFRVPKGPLARLAYAVAESKSFDRFILGCICINSITLAMEDPRGLSNADNVVPLEELDLIFMAVFFCEMLTKVAAYGWYTSAKQRKRDEDEDDELAVAAARAGEEPPLPRHPRYLDDAWNRLDFFIVLTSLMYFLQYFGVEGQDLDVLRTLRMLRPLRTINSIPEMRVLIDSLGESAKPMANVMLLCMFLFLVFALIGQQLFSGYMTMRCYKSSDYDELQPWMGDDYSEVYTVGKGGKAGERLFAQGVTLLPDNYTNPISARRCGGEYQCPAGWECRISGRQPRIANSASSSWGGLQEGELDPEGDRWAGGLKRPDFANPNMGMTNYDDIGHALLNIFVAVTLEGWADQMYVLQDSYGKFAAVCFFILLVVFGALFALNLALAVISDNYSADRHSSP